MVQEISTEIYNNARKYNKQMSIFVQLEKNQTRKTKQKQKNQRKSGEQNKYYSSEGKGGQAAAVSKYGRGERERETTTTTTTNMKQYKVHKQSTYNAHTRTQIHYSLAFQCTSVKEVQQLE